MTDETTRARRRMLMDLYHNSPIGRDTNMTLSYDEEGAAFGATDLASVARGFGLGGVTFRNLDGLDAAFDDFVASDKAALWDFHISDQVVSPVMRRLTAAKT